MTVTATVKARMKDAEILCRQITIRRLFNFSFQNYESVCFFRHTLV